MGSGGFGGPRDSDHVVKTEAAPNTKPDAVAEFKTNLDQASAQIPTNEISIPQSQDRLCGMFPTYVLLGLAEGIST